MTTGVNGFFLLCEPNKAETPHISQVLNKDKSGLFREFLVFFACTFLHGQIPGLLGDAESMTCVNQILRSWITVLLSSQSYHLK